MSEIQNYLAENAKWMSQGAVAAIEGIPASAWSSVIEAVGILTGGEDPGIDCAVAITHETTDDFDNARQNHWAKPGKKSVLSLNGLTAIYFEQFQLRNGDARRSQIVINCGTIRVCLIG